MRNNDFDDRQYCGAFDGAKKIYDSVSIPKELAGRVETALDVRRDPNRFRQRAAALAAVIACLFAVLTILINTNVAFAKAVDQIPVLRGVARVLTFRSWTENDASRDVSVQVPAVSNTGRAALEERVNHEIGTRVDALLAKARENAEAERKAYLETGGKAEEYQPAKINVSYQVKCSDETRLSFVVTETEVRATSSEQQIFYNIDLKTGRELTLADLLGAQYKQIADDSIRKQIQERLKNPNNQFFDGQEGFQSISDRPDFYMNSKGNPVIVFPKYAIAPGYMGVLEFEITR